MIKRVFLALLATAAFGTAQADEFWENSVKESMDATQLPELELLPNATPVPHDLTLDPGFGNGGLQTLHPPRNGWSNIEDGVQTFPWISQVEVHPGVVVPYHSGYYLVGKQQSADGTRWRPTIARVGLGGALDTTFAKNGWITSTGADDVVDAAISGNRLYVLTNALHGSVVPAITTVRCFDLTSPTGASCSSAWPVLVTFGTSNEGPRTAAYGQRLLHDSRYGLFVAARVMSNTRGQEVGIARLNASNGAVETSFGTNGYFFGLPGWSHPTQAEVAVHALATVPAGYDGGARLYVGGQAKLNTTNHDGFILGLAPTAGTISSPAWGWKQFFHEDDNAGNKKDAVTALTVLRNGKVAFAGWSETDDPDVRPLMMGRVHANGTNDSSFCAGNEHRSSRACLVDPPWIASMVLTYRPHSTPVAIGERTQTRDLVVVQRFRNTGTNVIRPDDGRIRTQIQQFSASGNTLRAARAISYPRSGSGLTWSRPFGMYLGPAAVKPEVMVVAGTRQWSSSDFDMTLTSLVATDTIFANQFGKDTSD